MGAGGSHLFPEPAGWGGASKGGPGLAGGQGTLPGQQLWPHPLLHAGPSTPAQPTHSSRQHPKKQPPCFLPRVTDCLCGPSQMQEPQAGCGLLALCCAVKNRTLRWFLVFNGDRLDGLTDCSGGCEDNQGQLSRGSWGSQTGARSPWPSRQAPGSQAQQLEHCCPLVATSAPGRFHWPGPASVFPWMTDLYRLLQGLHQGFIGLNTDLDLGLCCLVRCA